MLPDGMDNATALKRVHRLARTGQLVELRESVGLSQGDVARAVGVNQSAVSRWESSKARPRPRHAVELLDLLEDLA